jgi:G3E family GTPase
MEKDLYLITGFLGSGKTTFLKNMLSGIKDRKAAVILNEYGQEDVDGHMLDESVQKIVIENGSIFCTCRSDKFADALVMIGKLDVDMVLVESSGLSDPRGIGKIIDTANKLSAGGFLYRGMITVVSAANFLKLADVLNIIPMQIISSGMVIINKTDLADDETILKIADKIKSINNTAKIIKTTYARLDIKELFDSMVPDGSDHLIVPHDKDLSYRKKYMEVKKLLRPAELRSWLEAMSPGTYRIKGYVRTTEGWVHVDCAGEEIDIAKFEGKPERSFLVALGKNLDDIDWGM